MLLRAEIHPTICEAFPEITDESYLIRKTRDTIEQYEQWGQCEVDCIKLPWMISRMFYKILLKYPVNFEDIQIYSLVYAKPVLFESETLRQGQFHVFGSRVRRFIEIGKTKRRSRLFN
jgi:hypothetical protein